MDISQENTYICRKLSRKGNMKYRKSIFRRFDDMLKSLA